MSPIRPIGTAALLAAILAACATTPATVPAPAPAPAPVPAIAATAADSPAAAAAIPGAPDLVAVKRQAASLGFKPRLNNGVTQYCRSEQMIGSRIDSKTTCVTEASLPEMVRQLQDTKDALTRGQRTCVGSSCGSQ
jgi:hypothetical protein